MDDTAFAAPARPGCISQAPQETRWFIARLASLTVFFILVRGWLASRSYLRNLAIVMLVNGAALALFGLSHYFGPFPKRIPFLEDNETGSPFSTFINRNHFAFYINICIGLGMGLLFVDSKSSDVYKSARRKASARWQDQLADSFSGLFAILQNPRALWIIVLLMLCIVCVPLSKSRGGAVALFTAAALTTVAWSRVTDSRKRKIPLAVVAPFLVASFLAIWFTWESLTSRFEGDLQTLDDRSGPWRDGLRLLPLFWLFGSGAGSYVRVEPLRRGDETKRMLTDHAHNEYLEAIVEGGLPRIAITLALAWFAFRFAIRACQVHGRGSSGPLVLGCLFSLTTVAVHSFFEFGIHLGSIALLAAAVAACTSCLANDYTSADKKPVAPASRTYALAVALVFPLLCALLGWQTYVQWQAQNFLREASKERSRSLTPVSVERRLAFSAAAAAAAPYDPDVLVVRGTCLADAARLQKAGSAESQALLTEAVRNWIVARSLGPLLPQPHALLGAYRDAMKSAEPALVYYERARLLQPTDPDIHYYCGKEHWKAGRDEEAIKSWRRSLDLSFELHKEILTAASERLGPKRLAEEIVPDNPIHLRNAAALLYPDEHVNPEERRPFLEKAARVLALSPEPTEGWAFVDLARIYAELGDGKKAVEMMRKATRQNPDRADWRIELALQLRANKEYKAAAAELKRIYLEKEDPTAKGWLEFVKREIMLRNLKGPD